MYIVYEEHIEQLEEENEDLKQEIVILRQRLKYFREIEDKEDLNN
jgi:cell division septum initiation protein DivIVA|tara:strand:+ start:730 stop:864 length:135 start_codon:yes stop_codon:yes gene_type:complete